LREPFPATGTGAERAAGAAADEPRTQERSADMAQLDRLRRCRIRCNRKRYRTVPLQGNRMRHLLLFSVAAAVIVATPAFATEPSGVIDSAHSLAHACRLVERMSTAGTKATRVPADAVVCVGYMQAMQDFAVLSDENQQRLLGTCPAATTTLGELIRAFLDYFRSHPDRADEKAAVAVIRSFQDAYPCLPTGQTADAPEPSLYPAARK
jgi:hypothetical protein